MVFTCLLATLAVGCPATSRCQGAQFGEFPAWFSVQIDATTSVAFGDIDGDGDLDLAHGALGATIYINNGTMLEASPSWTPAVPGDTRDVAFGDVDGDGDLDLVCGNSAESTTLYLNREGVLETVPSWSSGLASATAGVALGDIDGDGDLDLVCGNGGESSTLYINHEGALNAMPSWSSGLASATTSVALGDIDGDGDLDLVCGNTGESSTLYINRQGVLESMPSWSSGLVAWTYSVALGDIDGDGDLDLVCGNAAFDAPTETVHLYENEEGAFEAMPSWSAGLTTYGQSKVALADVDADGDIDLACGNAGKSARLYVNNGGMLETTPAWSSGLTEYTYSVALGDVDGDGDLDLVCGNDGESSTLYLNQCGILETAPEWTSEVASWTQSAAIGDIDRDGDLDLTCGNYGTSSAVYLGQGGALEETPSWYSGLQSWTKSIALADMNGDGYLDLVCGNSGESSTVYMNREGILETMPSWSAGRADLTTSVAPGDVDNDGDVDLVCGNYVVSNMPWGPTALYLNREGTLETMPSSFPGTIVRTGASVALGDVDGDGDLDLVCGNYETPGTSAALYLNDGGGVFDALPSWSSGRSDPTTSVALGDVDGDGDPDLVCGNYGKSATIYANSGGVLETEPLWSSERSDPTTSVALGDVDGDGDLDLVCGNSGERNSIYLNRSGVLETTPSWFSDRVDLTVTVALGDLDGDGDADLVCGAGATDDSTRCYMGYRGPAYRGKPLDPACQLPNNGAHLRLVHSGRSGPDTRTVYLKAVDLESDPIWLVPEYCYEGAAQWHPADIVGSSGRAGPFGTSPAGVTDSLEWNTHLLPFDRRGVILRLRTIEIPRRVSVIQHSASYLLEVGPVEPHRPEISASADAVTFATVTVGDSASVDVVIRNTGNLPLAVNNIELPSTEMRHELSTPLELSPGERDTLRISLEPRIQYGVSGDVRIASNDPLTPVLSIGVTTDIRPLRFRTRLLNPAQEVPLGEALGFNIIPDADVTIEGGYVHYRAAGVTGVWSDSVGLARLAEGDFVATIPGEGVTEAGLEYYIKVENSGVYATDPPGAPFDSVFHQAVASPSAIMTTPIPTRGSDFLQGQETRVQVSLPIGASFQDGLLHFRRGGAMEFEDVAVAPGDPLPYAVIPGQAAEPRGIEYWVEIQTLTQRLTDPPGDPARAPRVLRVTTADLAEPASHPGERYRLLSIPLELNTPLVGVVTDDIGGPDNTRWRMFAYDTFGASYTELPSTDISSFELGKGYWLITKESHQLDTAPAEGLSTSTENPLSIRLAPGWNLVGNPFAFPVAWDSMMVDGTPMNEAEGAWVERARAWVTSNNAYNDPVMDPVEMFVSFDGYWVKNLTDSAVTLRIPPREAVAVAQSELQRPVARTGRGVEDWLLGITVTCGALSDRGDYIGVRPMARDEWDKTDRSEVPMPPGEGMSLYFPHWSWERHSGTYSVDIRPVSAANRVDESRACVAADLRGNAWAFDIAKNFSRETAGDEVVLEFSGLETIPEDVEIVLVDRTLEQRVDLRKEPRHSFFLGRRDPVTRDEDTRFTLLVGSGEFVDTYEQDVPTLPRKTALHQNRPNPFNPSTIIQYELAQAGRVTLKIYDVSGALVKVLEDRDRQPGRYEIGWNADDGRGNRVSSGVYFYQIETTGFTQTRKMVILK